ncbi:hypothetical protein [Microbispora sp. NBRC 16548]|uniref:hypothetical protein n=1 Tax=Microbispora sp. NBRC 16548 TaxID=3030994 RepID=UPI002555D5D9|nr:hypothetical protein [Microbispora sp. NBRC 16548]
MLSPVYAAALLEGLASQGWPTWSLLFGGIICVAVLYLVGRIRETPLGWQAFSLGSTVAGTGYLVATTEAGWLHPIVLASWAALAGGATYARGKIAEHYAPAEKTPAEAPPPKKVELPLAPAPHPLQAMIDDICQRLAQLRTKIGIPELEIIGQQIVSETRFTVTVRTRMPLRDISPSREGIAARLELPVGMLRQITGLVDNAGVQVFHFQIGQPHRGEPIVWRPPRWEGDILTPFKIGIREDEEDATMLLATRQGGVRHGAVSGKSGYGKTVHQMVVAANVANCINAVVLVADLKGTHDFAPFAPLTPWYATTAEEATRQLVSVARLCEPGPYNRGPLKVRGDRVIVPTEDSVAIILLYDEIRMVFSAEMNPNGYKLANAAAATIALLGRAFGIGIHVAGQDMSETAMPQTRDTSGTAFRRQLHHRRVFHEDDKRSGQFLLDDFSRLDVTTLETPGRFFHAEGKEPSLPTLGYDIPDPLAFHEWALTRSDSVRGVDERTTRLLGDDFTTAHQRLPAEVAEWMPSRPRRRVATMHPVPGLRRRAQQTAREMLITARPEVQATQDLEELEARLSALDSELEGDLDGFSHEADEAGEVVPLANPTLEAFAVALEHGRRTGVNRVGLMDATRMKRTWLSVRLNLLSEDGVLYSRGQTRAKLWFLADGVSGRRLREAIEAADEAIRTARTQDEDTGGSDGE